MRQHEGEVKMVLLYLVCCFVLDLLFRPSIALSHSTCMYLTKEGMIKGANSLQEVPAEYQRIAKCFDGRSAPRIGPRPVPMALPSEVDLEGNIRRVTMSSPMGRIELRWARTAERLFGRTPERAVAEAMHTVSRTLRRGGFPPELQRISEVWKIVFMDEKVPEKEIPAALISNCHPAWMTGPANIYVVSQRVVGGCDPKKHLSTARADAELAKVLLHEIGHVIEYNLLKGNQGGDRVRAEGFATWFEQYASDTSSLFSKGELRSLYTAAAKRSLMKAPLGVPFRGTFDDYAKASLIFTAVVDRKGISGLIDVYKRVAENRTPFIQALEESFYWDKARLTNEIRRLLEAQSE